MQKGGLPFRCDSQLQWSIPFPLASISHATYLQFLYLFAVVGCLNQLVAKLVASCKLWLQGDRSRLGLRGSASSEFVPTLSKRDESEVIFPQEKQEVQTEALTLDRLSGGKVSITLERQQQTPRRLGGVLVANEQVVGPRCAARSVNFKNNPA